MTEPASKTSNHQRLGEMLSHLTPKGAVVPYNLCIDPNNNFWVSSKGGLFKISSDGSTVLFESRNMFPKKIAPYTQVIYNNGKIIYASTDDKANSIEFQVLDLDGKVVAQHLMDGKVQSLALNNNGDIFLTKQPVLGEELSCIYKYKDDLLVMDKTGRFQLFDKSGTFKEVSARIDAYIGNGFVVRGDEAVIVCSGIVTDSVLETVSDGLKKIYKQKLYPLEEFYKFHDFHSPALDDPDFNAKPMILLVGQYSTGKTTFIRYLLEENFPGIRIGPEPTTDRFIAVMYGDEEGCVPGNALVVDSTKQFRALTKIERGYDFSGVLEWFAERVDRIILLFDAHKLDISDEFKRCIEALSGNEDKIRIVLNKSDMVDHQQLMRVYGALMWSLGKVFKTPEVARVYIGTFWDNPLNYDINRRLFDDEKHDLFADLQSLPRNAALRKLNDLIKRARLAKVHAYIIAELRKQMPSMIGKEKKKKELIQKLDKIFDQLQKEHNISPGDFPDVERMREHLQNSDFTKFNAIKPRLLEVVDNMLATDIARLMAQIPKEEAAAAAAGGEDKPKEQVRGGAFDAASELATPFGFGKGEGYDKGADEEEWVVSRERQEFDHQFNLLNPIDGKVSGRIAKEHMLKSKLPNSVLGKIWKLADVDKDGMLDAEEFSLASYLINLKLEGHEVPNELPRHLIPPSKKADLSDTIYPALDS